MSFLRDYVFDLENQERKLWSALEYLGIRGGAPLALILYVIVFVLAAPKLPWWESSLLAVGGLIVLALLFLQRAAFHRFMTGLRRERDEADSALIHHLNQHGATDFLRTAGTHLGKLKALLDRY